MSNIRIDRTPTTALIISSHEKSSLMERYKFHQYLVNPLKRTWGSSIKVLSICYLFVARCLDKLIKKGREC